MACWDSLTITLQPTAALVLKHQREESCLTQALLTGASKQAATTTLTSLLVKICSWSNSCEKGYLFSKITYAFIYHASYLDFYLCIPSKLKTVSQRSAAQILKCIILLWGPWAYGKFLSISQAWAPHLPSTYLHKCGCAEVMYGFMVSLFLSSGVTSCQRHGNILASDWLQGERVGLRAADLTVHFLFGLCFIQMLQPFFVSWAKSNFSNGC